jgi:hypothetical protein
MMTKNDQSLLRQMIRAGKFNYPIYELLVEHNAIQAKEMIKKMGDKWCLHPANNVKRLDIPLPILSESRGSKILKGKK